MRATGKAILMLIEEIERLHIDLWNAKPVSAGERPADESEADIRSAFERDEPDRLAQTLSQRLGRLRRHA